MSSEKIYRDEILELAQEAKEYLSYLSELGVKGVEDDEGVSFNTERQTARVEALLGTEAGASKNVAALRRNADAAARAESSLTEQQKGEAQRKQESANAAPAISPTSFEHTEMAKRTTKKYPDAVPPPPQETLFGEITPADDESLPRRDETLEDIWQDIGVCMRCPLCCEGRTQVVNSEGNRKARLMFVGEAPGADEDASGRPFVGRAGQLLNKIIEAIGMKREDVFIGNVNRCRPPQNRTPVLSEAATCKPFLLREIAVVQPEVIVVLGNTALHNLLETKVGITKVRGQFQDYKGIKVMPTFHPAYLLRDPSKKREAWEDMKKVRDYLDGKLKL